MLYFIMSLMAVIPFLMLVLSLNQLKKEAKKGNVSYLSDSAKKYSAQRMRGSVRQGMNRIKTADDYYIIEKSISFPKK
ncbi:MAG: hypothetical protein K2I06_01555 [Ruminococcus sp.]|nr:hypothetical protein [Ruminococcus sp.]